MSDHGIAPDPQRLALAEQSDEQEREIHRFDEEDRLHRHGPVCPWPECPHGADCTHARRAA